MSHLARTTATQGLTALPSDLGILTRLRRHFARIEAAMAGQARRSEIRPETVRDTRLSPEDLTGAPSHDPDLPFFLQSGFGRSDR